MVECKYCGHKIDARTDDNYNSTGDAICCDECLKWTPAQLWGD